MLPEKYRLKKKNDFARVMQGKGGAVSSCLILRFCSNQTEVSRAGFVCSKKVAKKAVARNKIKRRLREMARALWPNVKAGYDLVFIAKLGIADKDFAEIKASVENLLKKARLLK